MAAHWKILSIRIYRGRPNEEWANIETRLLVLSWEWMNRKTMKVGSGTVTFALNKERPNPTLFG